MAAAKAGRLIARFIACRTRLSTNGCCASSSRRREVQAPEQPRMPDGRELTGDDPHPLACASLCRGRSISAMCTSPVSSVASRVTPSGTQRNSSSGTSGVCRQCWATRRYRTWEPTLRSTNSKGPVPTTFWPYNALPRHPSGLALHHQVVISGEVLHQFRGHHGGMKDDFMIVHDLHPLRQLLRDHLQRVLFVDAHQRAPESSIRRGGLGWTMRKIEWRHPGR